MLGLNSRKVYETTKPYLSILGHFNYKRELLMILYERATSTTIYCGLIKFYTQPIQSYKVDYLSLFVVPARAWMLLQF